MIKFIYENNKPEVSIVSDSIRTESTSSEHYIGGSLHKLFRKFRAMAGAHINHNSTKKNVKATKGGIPFSSDIFQYLQAQLRK